MSRTDHHTARRAWARKCRPVVVCGVTRFVYYTWNIGEHTPRGAVDPDSLRYEPHPVRWDYSSKARKAVGDVFRLNGVKDRRESKNHRGLNGHVYGNMVELAGPPGPQVRAIRNAVAKIIGPPDRNIPHAR